MGNTGMQILDASTVDQRFTLGDTFESNGKKYRYVKFGANASVGNILRIDMSAWTTSSLTTALATVVSYVGIAQYAAVSGEYGWVQTGGALGTLTCGGAVAAGAKCYTTTTAGQVDDTVGSNVLISGLTVHTAVTGAGNSAFGVAVGEMSINT